MTARSDYEGKIAPANTTKLASDQTAEATYNATVDAAKQAYVVAGGTFATYDSAVKAAQATLIASKQKNAAVHQVTVQAAKDTLRAAGDTAPA